VTAQSYHRHMKQSGYDRRLKRWYRRPMTHRWSEMVLGRREVSIALIETGTVLVSCYRYKNRLRYSGPVKNEQNQAGPGVLYRIRVKMKQGVSI